MDSKKTTTEPAKHTFTLTNQYLGSMYARTLLFNASKTACQQLTNQEEVSRQFGNWSVFQPQVMYVGVESVGDRNLHPTESIKLNISPFSEPVFHTGRRLTEKAAVTDIVNFSPLWPTIQSGSLRFRSIKYFFMQLYFITK